MTVREYVLQQLRDHNQIRKEITVLEFELKALLPLDTSDLIESMTFTHPAAEAVQNNNISDKTAVIALNYRHVGQMQSHEAIQPICEQLEIYRLQADRLELYISTLNPEIAAVLRQHYFDGLTWEEIADRSNNCLRTVKNRRERGIERLVELYGKLVSIGRLPEVTLP